MAKYNNFNGLWFCFYQDLFKALKFFKIHSQFFYFFLFLKQLASTTVSVFLQQSVSAAPEMRKVRPMLILLAPLFRMCALKTHKISPFSNKQVRVILTL